MRGTENCSLRIKILLRNDTFETEIFQEVPEFSEPLNNHSNYLLRVHLQPGFWHKLNCYLL